MTDIEPSETEKAALQQFYLATRTLLKSEVIPPWAAQRGFEETIGGYLDVHTWRPTHVSHAAAQEIVNGSYRNVQRAHGIGGRLDRYKRTLKVLTDPEQDFDAWWSFYLEHDATVLITKKEHSAGQEFELKSLIKLPPHPHGMFTRAGFSFKVRKKVEVVWLREALKELK
jgi:hypothetical protein